MRSLSLKNSASLPSLSGTLPWEEDDDVAVEVDMSVIVFVIGDDGTLAIPFGDIGPNGERFPWNFNPNFIAQLYFIPLGNIRPID